MSFSKFITTCAVSCATLLAPANLVFADSDEGIRPQATCKNAPAGMNLQKGDYGVGVQNVQAALGIRPADGCFGNQTHKAVEAYQACHGLVVDGKVGPQTWRAINAGKTLEGCARTVSAAHESAADAEHRIVIDQWKEVVRLKIGDETIESMRMTDNHNVLAKGTYFVCEFIRSNSDHSHTWKLLNFVRLCREDGSRTGIGFHAIPVRISTGEAMHDESFLGTGKKQSSGCIRLSMANSQILWDFAKKGMKVVVV